MVWKKVTGLNNEVIFINLDLAWSMSGHASGTTIRFGAGEKEKVDKIKDTPEQILDAKALA